MKKRLCSLALALCLALSLVPGAAAAGLQPLLGRARQPLGPQRGDLRL